MIERFSSCQPIAPLSAISGQCPDPLKECERISTLNFHVETGDYFLFVCALLGFIEETLDAGDCSKESIALQLEAIRAARKDLFYMDAHFRIQPVQKCDAHGTLDA